jgi:FtsP/CotA-like multicopper oxidase with cupredoxin domain
VALDGHDLHDPSPLTQQLLPISAAQRYDLAFVVPASGTVALLDADADATPRPQGPPVVLGDTTAPVPSFPEAARQFDFATYGTPTVDRLTPETPMSARYDLRLGSRLGLFDGMLTRLFTINGQVFPHVPEVLVAPGEVVELHLTNTDDRTGQIHPMHLHGHTFTVLRKNGQPLTGSPIHLDTIAVAPGESYDVAFVADNTGLWMFHCHIGGHAARGMDTMLAYQNVSTPFTIGRASGNHPE